MQLRKRAWRIGAVTAIAAAPLLVAATPAHAASATTYVPGAPTLDGVVDGPYNLSQPDTGPDASPAQTQYPTGDLLPTYTPTGSNTSTAPSDLPVYPAASAPPGPPYASGVAGDPGPVPGYCSSGGPAPESGTQVAEPTGVDLPMSPYYFPFVTQTAGDSTQGHLTGYFDWRPKDTEEGVVTANSVDGGKTWTATGKALEENPENYCPTGDTNDNGEGHSFVTTVNGTPELYTLNRPAGDNIGVGLLVHTVNPSATDPVAGLPTVESVGTDPDTFAAGAASVATSGSATIAVTTLGSGAEAVGAGKYLDVSSATPTTVITCTGTSGPSLTGCSATAPMAVAAGDELESVLATVTTAGTIAQGPNTVAESGGSNIALSTPLSGIAAANVPGRFYVDGSTVYCVNISKAATTLQNCTTTKSGGQATAVGDAVITDPIVPAASSGGSVQQTTGLVAPDGIVGVVPASLTGTKAAAGSLYSGVPAGATTVIYGEKILNYFDEGTTTASVALSTAPVSFSMTPSTTQTAPIPTTGSFNVYVSNSAGIFTVTCTGYTAPTFSGCTIPSASGSQTIASGSEVGGPGAAIAPYSQLSSIGEGSNSSKNAIALFKNNEDYTALRAAYTTDGVDFTDLGLISGTDPGQDINNPASQASPATMDLPQGSADNPELRFVGTRGTIITNPDGSIGMFDSGAWESDGDSDAFNQVFYTSSTDGVHWTTPVVVESTDYTFSARQTQDANLAKGVDTPLNVSGYFAGRAYSPTVVQNPDGTLTLVYSGYSTPKPVPVDGAVLGDQQGGAPQWTVTAADPALYRNILTVTLNPVAPPASLPETPLAVGVPLAGMVVGGGALWLVSRRRRASTAAR